MSVQINVQASQTALAQSIAQGVAAFNARYAGQNQLNLQINARSFSQPLGRITSDLADFESALKASNARVLAFGASTAVLGGVVRSFKEIASVTIEVEKSLTDINRVLNLSTNNLQKFSSELFSISKQTASSFDDATKAALEFSRQGLNTEETLKRTADALTLVRLTGISSTKAVEDLTATVNGFSKAGITTSQVVNKLAAVEQDFAVSASDLTEALSRTGQAAQEAGVSFDELNALVTTAQQNTARGGAVIGNALKTIFTRLQRTETLDQLENFNIAVRDVQGNILPAVQILKNFADQYNNLADAQRAQLSEQVAGVYQVNILKGVISDLNNSQGTYVKALERGSMAANEADIANQKLNKTLSALVTQTGVGLQQLANNVGKVTFAPIFEAIVSPVNDAVSYINDTLEGEGIGSIFANGLLKGIRNVIAGPGLAVGFAVIAKVAKNTFEDATKALPAILGLTTEAQKRANIEKSILSILQTQSQLSLALQGQQGNLSTQAATVLNYAQLQTAQYQQQLQIAQQLAPLLAAQNVTVGARGIQVGARIKAGGHIPAFAEMSERMGAAMGGYKSGSVVKAPTSVGANTYMNSAEKVKYIPGFAQPFINPPANSKAGRAHRQNAISRTGVDPYMAAIGFIPNFAQEKFVTEKLNVKDGDTISAYPVEPLSRDYRLANVDTPEYGQFGYEEAKKLLEYRYSGDKGVDLLNSNIVKGSKAAFYRGVFNDQAISKLLVQRGLAVPDFRYTRDNELISLANNAMAEKIGIFKYHNHPKVVQFKLQKELIQNIKEEDYKSTSKLGETVLRRKAHEDILRIKSDQPFKAYSQGFIPNFAVPTSAMRIPWFKKFANPAYDNIQPTLGISKASDVDTFRTPQFRSKAFEKAATNGDPNIFGPLYEDFARKALQLVNQSNIFGELIRGSRLTPKAIPGQEPLDAGIELPDGTIIPWDFKGFGKNNLSGGSIAKHMTDKYNRVLKTDPEQAAKIKEAIMIFNEPGHENQLPSEFGKNFIQLAGTSYSQMLKNSPTLVKELSNETNMLLDKYVKNPQFLKMNAAGGFIPNFANYNTDALERMTMEFAQKGKNGATLQDFTQFVIDLNNNKYGVGDSFHKDIIAKNFGEIVSDNDLVSPKYANTYLKGSYDKNSGKIIFYKSIAQQLDPLFERKHPYIKTVENELKQRFANRQQNAPVRVIQKPPSQIFREQHPGPSSENYFNNGFIPNFADLIQTEIDAFLKPISKSGTIQSGKLFGKTLDRDAIKYLNDTSIEKLNKYLGASGYLDGALGVRFPDHADKKFLFTKNQGFIPNFANKSIADHKSIRAIYDLYIGGKKINEKNGTLDELLKIADPNNKQFKQLKTKGTPWTVQDIKGLPISEGIYANGFIPNFAYKQSVMSLEENMSGKNAILDTTTGPFPFIRNSGQPNFASAISDHGGLKNALNDSMRNQEAAGLMSSGYIPNFASVKAQQAFGVPFSALSSNEQKLFADMNKALVELTKNTKLTSQQQQILVNTVQTNALVLQRSTKSASIVSDANDALVLAIQQNAQAQTAAAQQTTASTNVQAAQQQDKPSGFERIGKFLGGSKGAARGAKIEASFSKLSNNIGFTLGVPMLAGAIESAISQNKERSEMGYGRRLASSGTSAALSGATTGAMLGSVIPGIGNAAGAAIGALVGFAGAAINAKDSLDDLQKISEKYRNETQTAVESGRGIINIIKSLNDLDPNSLEAFDANQKLQDYFVKLADTGLDIKFREAGNDIESMVKAIKDYETERATQAKRNSENEKRMLDESLSIEDIRKKGILKVEDIIEKRTYRKFKPTEQQKRIYGPNVTEGMVPLGSAQYENATYDLNLGQRIVGTGTVGDVNFQSVIKQYPQLFDDLKKVQKQLGDGFKKFSEVLKDEADDWVFNEGRLIEILKQNPIEGIDPNQLAVTLQTVAKDSGLQGKFIIEYFDQIMAGLASGKFKTAAEAAIEVKNKIIARQQGIRDKLFKYSQAIEQSISEIGIQIENYEFEKNFGKLNLEKSAQIINEGLSAISKNINDAFKNQFDFIIEQTSVLQQKRLLDFEAQNFQKDLAAQAESRRLGRAKELISVLQTALSETAADQLDILVSQFRSTGKVDISGIDQKYLAKPEDSKRALQAFNLTTKISEEEAKNKEENARRIFMVEQAYAKQSLQLKNETSKLDYDLSERRYKNTVREKELVDSISNQSRQIQIKGQAQIERSRIEAESPYFMLGRGENAIADEKRRREAAATQQGFELEARQAIADAEIAKIQREVFADNTKATLDNTIAIEALIMSMTKGGADAFTTQTKQIDNINRRLLPKEEITNIDERIKSLEKMNLDYKERLSFSGGQLQSINENDKELNNLREKKQEQERLRKEKSDLLDSSAYAANKAASEIYNSQMQAQIARQTLAKRPVKSLQLSGIDLSTIKDPIKYLNESVVTEKEKLKSIQLQKENLESQDKQGKLTTEQKRELVSLNDQFSQQTQLVNNLTTAQLSIEQKITNEYFKRKQYIEDIQKRGTFTAGVAKAVGTIRTETEMFKETLGSTTVNAFRDGLVGAMDAALNKADDLDSALRQVAAGFLREIQGVMLRNIANQFVSSIMPEKFVATSAVGEQKGGYIRAQKGMYISGGRTGDKNPALLEDGEYVLNRNAVKALGGPRAIDNLNFNTFPRFATGGDPGTMSASADAGAAFERLSMFGREQSPEFQTYMDKIREEEAIKEKKRAERKALLNQFLGTLITTGISMGLSSAFDAAKNASQATANLKGAVNTDTGVAINGFSDAKKIVDAGGSITLANGTQVNSSYFGGEAFTRSSFNQLAASRFADSGISGVTKSGYLVQGKVPYGTGKNEFAPINKTFKSPYDAMRYSQSLPSGFKLKPTLSGRRQEGGIIGLNQGGFLPYGSRLTDSIPAYLSGGEYVVNSRAVRKYGVGGMNRINSGVARFEDGGLVGSEGMSGSNTSNTSNSNIAINITVNATNGKSDNEQSNNNENGTEGNAKELSNRIKSVVLDVITNEQRTGGLLDSTKKK